MAPTPSLYLNKTTPPVWWLSGAIQVLHSNHYTADSGTLLLDVDPTVSSVPPATPANPNPSSSPHRQFVQVRAGNDADQRFDDVRVQLWVAPFSTAMAPSHYLQAFQGSGGVALPVNPPLAIDGRLQLQNPQSDPDATRNFEHPADKSNGLWSVVPPGFPGAGLPNPQLSAFWDANGDVHCCAFANVYSPTDPASAAIAGPPVVTGATSTFAPATNRHHAQRNLTIKKQPAGGDAMKIKMFMGNPDPEKGGDHWVELVETPATELAGWEVAELATAGPWIRATKGRRPGLEVVVDRRTFPVPLKGPAATAELQVDGGASRRRPARLEPGEIRDLELFAKLPKRDFGVNVFDLIQRDGKGTIVGGARATVLTVPAELLRKRRVPRLRTADLV